MTSFLVDVVMVAGVLAGVAVFVIVLARAEGRPKNGGGSSRRRIP